MQKSTRSFVLISLLAGAAAVLNACRPTPTEGQAVGQRPAATVPAASAESTYDQALTDGARVLAGLPPSSTGRLGAVAAKPEWEAWRKEFEAHWTAATRDRFARMAAWRDQELKTATGACDTLMYPFSGPDILNAVLLFPDCQRYVLFGLEQTGSLPALDRLPPDRLARLLEETRQALNDLLERNYFITSHMMKDTSAAELHGTLPLIAVSLVRLEAQIVSARNIEIAPDGQVRPRTPAPGDSKAAPALEVVFVRPGRQPQTAIYFRAQAEDALIRQRPGVVPFLEQHAPFATFLKSASYLLHGSDFSVVRQLLLAGSRLILEDDSGVPLRFLRAPAWAVTFYGKYDKPVKDFNYGYQPDMARVYADPANVKPLTFSFGYHWRDGASSVLLAVRNPASAPRPETPR